MLVARQRILESKTDRDNHDQGSTRGWKYRTYKTNITIGNDGTVGLYAITDPVATQELRVDAANTLIGIHLLTSFEWDLSEAELAGYAQTVNAFSQYLYNATDGQFFIERMDVVDDAALWDPADVRVYADNSLRASAECPRGGFFGGSLWCGDSWIKISRADAPPTYAHEFGHYGLDLPDEYDDDDSNVRCTRATAGSVPMYGSGGSAASCMMWNQWQAGKICSNRGENRHSADDEDCWRRLTDKYSDDSRANRLKTPDSRGAVVNGLSQVIPVSDWLQSTFSTNRFRNNLCTPFTAMFVDSNSRPAVGFGLWIWTSYGQVIYLGKTDGAGQIPVVGVHWGTISSAKATASRSIPGPADR